MKITWQGPNNERDFITIVPAGTPERQYKACKYTKEGSSLELRAREVPGEYEVRYLTGQTYATLATAKVTVGGARRRCSKVRPLRLPGDVQRHVDRARDNPARTSSTW